MQEDYPEFTVTDIESTPTLRKTLLPWWIKVFSWIFAIMGIMVPVVVVMRLLNYPTELSLYGVGTNDAFTMFGVVILLLFALKATTAFCLLTRKNSAISLGIVDAVVGIVICVSIMGYTYLNPETRFSIRGELLLLVPYLIALQKIKSAWKEGIA